MYRLYRILFWSVEILRVYDGAILGLYFSLLAANVGPQAQKMFL